MSVKDVMASMVTLMFALVVGIVLCVPITIAVFCSGWVVGLMFTYIANDFILGIMTAFGIVGMDVPTLFGVLAVLMAYIGSSINVGKN